MKKYIIILTLFLSGCAPVYECFRKVPYSERTYHSDTSLTYTYGEKIEYLPYKTKNPLDCNGYGEAREVK